MNDKKQVLIGLAMLLLVISSMFALRLSLITIIIIGAVVMLLAWLESGEESGQPEKAAVMVPHASPRRR